MIGRVQNSSLTKENSFCVHKKFNKRKKNKQMDNNKVKDSLDNRLVFFKGRRQMKTKKSKEKKLPSLSAFVLRSFFFFS